MDGKRGIGGRRVVRVNLSMASEYHSKLKKLSTACDMQPTTLAMKLIELSLDSPSVIQWLQDKYNKQEEYRVTPISSNGMIIY